MREGFTLDALSRYATTNTLIGADVFLLLYTTTAAVDDRVIFYQTLSNRDELNLFIFKYDIFVETSVNEMPV